MNLAQIDPTTSTIDFGDVREDAVALTVENDIRGRSATTLRGVQHDLRFDELDVA